MEIPFFKYQGTGNDFIIVDQFDQVHLASDNASLVRKLCNRKFGIGADGLILLLPNPECDFEMVYFNSDGNTGSLCGNGSRCAVECMRFLKRIENECTFLASDGYHSARIDRPGYVEVLMQDVLSIQAGDDFTIMDTGSPHYVTFVENIKTLDATKQGRAIRFSDPFRKEGINVNFVQLHDSSIEVATYERGVEDETLSCGTGVTASALAYGLRNGDNREYNLPVLTQGGQLYVKFIRSGTTFRNIWLCGPAELVFTGVWSDHSEEN
jgi:diaminopimelate epimerase